MLIIPPNVASVIVQGLEREIKLQREIGANCGDDWPDDYDPNDIAIYQGFCDQLRQDPTRDTVIDGDFSFSDKVNRFVLCLIPYFVQESVYQLSASDVDAAYRTFSEYVALRCREVLLIEEGKWRDAAQVDALRLISRLITFPRTSDAGRSS